MPELVGYGDSNDVPTYMGIGCYPIIILPLVATKKVHRKEKKEKKKEKSLKIQQYFPTKQVSDESEQLEKSCLTEELHVGYLSDSSQNSKKRSREASPVVESHIKATNPLRIRFVFKKPKEAEVVPQEDRVCSTSGTERPIEIPSSVSVPKTSDHDENLLSTFLQSDKIALPCESKKRKKQKSSKESRYSTLFDEWVPRWGKIIATAMIGFLVHDGKRMLLPKLSRIMKT